MIFNWYSVKIAEKGLHFSIAISEQIPLKLLIDEIRIRQILLNLLSNAVKFTKQGNIAVTAVGHVLADSDYADLTISVTDTGIGIPSDQIDVIFESFTQQKIKVLPLAAQD